MNIYMYIHLMWISVQRDFAQLGQLPLSQRQRDARQMSAHTEKLQKELPKA